MLDRTFCALRRNSIRLSFQKGAADQGLSHFGGVPDVPEGFEWPCFNTDSIDEPSGDVRLRPLAFLAQFDCEELAKYDRENLLPHTGVLSFFYSIESNRWGFDPEDFGCSRVYWFGNAEELRPAQLPEGLSEAYRFPSLKIEMTAKDSWPDYDDLPQGWMRTIMRSSLKSRTWTRRKRFPSCSVGRMSFRVQWQRNASSLRRGSIWGEVRTRSRRRSAGRRAAMQTKNGSCFSSLTP